MHHYVELLLCARLTQFVLRCKSSFGRFVWECARPTATILLPTSRNLHNSVPSSSLCPKSHSERGQMLCIEEDTACCDEMMAAD